MFNVLFLQTIIIHPKKNKNKNMCMRSIICHSSESRANVEKQGERRGIFDGINVGRQLT
jgi:hypothetical protein